MLNNKRALTNQLHALGLSVDEARIYLELLKGPSTHARLAKATGVNRTKVYRVADQLENRSLLTKRVDDRGLMLVAAEPSVLEAALLAEETALEHKRAVFRALVPQLESTVGNAGETTVHTHAGTTGFRQMLWNELRTKDTLRTLGGCLLEDLVPDPRWAERYRARVAAAAYSIRELVNLDDPHEPVTKVESYLRRYTCRRVPDTVLALDRHIAIYNDTVAMYSWRSDPRVGFEVVDHDYATMMRQVFDHYWSMAHDDSTRELS